MKLAPPSFRPMLLAVVAVALAASSGCHWFRHDHSPDYAKSKENRPLEVPPDLNLPDTSSSVPMPAANGLGAGNQAAANGVLLSVSAADAYPKVATALEGIPDVVINGRSEALHSFDVTYEGESFLIRVQDRQGGSSLLALSADGQLLTGGASAILINALVAKL